MWSNPTSLISVSLCIVFLCIGNILVIVIVATTKTFHSVTSVLIMNLAISDLLVGVGVMPFVALSIMNRGWVDCTVRHLCLKHTVTALVSDSHFDISFGPLVMMFCFMLMCCSLSCLTGPLFVRGLHLLCVLYSLCTDTGCYCP